MLSFARVSPCPVGNVKSIRFAVVVERLPHALMKRNGISLEWAPIADENEGRICPLIFTTFS